MATVVTSLRGRVPLLNLDKGSPIPPGFVLQLADELPPTNITDGLGKRVILDHVLDRQILDAYRLVLTNNAGREFVLVVSSPIRYPGMETSDLETSLVAVLAALFLLGQPPLSLGQFLFLLVEELGIAHMLTVRGDDHTLQTKVKPDLLSDDGKRCNVLFNQNGDKVPIGRVLGDSHGCGLTSVWQGTGPHDREWLVHPGQRESRSIPLEGSTYVRSGLLPMTAFKLWVVSTPFKEVLEGFLQVPKRLLQGNRGNLLQPTRPRLALESGETSRSVAVVETGLSLVVGIGPQSQCPIVDESLSTKGQS